MVSIVECPPQNKVESSEFVAKYVKGCKVAHGHHHACTHMHTNVECVCAYSLLNHLVGREYKLHKRAKLDCNQGILLVFHLFFLHGT